MSNVCMCVSVRAKNIFDRVAMENFSIKIDENVRLRLYKICRLCGDDNPNNTDILVNNKKNTNLDPDFHKKIFECVGIQVTKGDKMPQTACNVCREKINDFFEFREMCLATDVQTRRLLGLPDITTPKPDPAFDSVEDDKSEVEKTIKKKNPAAKALKTAKSIKPERRTTIDQRKAVIENKKTQHVLRRSSIQDNKKTVSVEVKKLIPERKKSFVETKKVIKIERDKTATKIKKKVTLPAKQPVDIQNKYKANIEKFSRAKKRKASGDLLTEKPPNKRERLRDNIIRKLKNPQIALVAVTTNVLCSICNKAFCNAGELHRHLDTDHIPRIVSFHCVKCNESIEKKQDIRDHTLWHKLSKTPYECGLCAKAIMSLAVYTKHVQNCTEFVQEFEYKTKTCSICKEQFATQNLYNWHKCIINQLKCEVCQQKFTKRGAMLRHVVRCTAIGLSTSLPVVDSALDAELDPDPDPEPLPGIGDHFADADDSDGSETEMNLKPNLEIDIEVPRAERKGPKKQTSPFVVIPSELKTAEKKKTNTNSRKSSAADNSSASKQAVTHNNPVEEPQNISNPHNAKVSTPTPMVCIKLDGKKQSSNNSKVPDQSTADSVRIKAEIIDSSYEGLYDTQMCSNIKKEIDTDTPEQRSPSKCSPDKTGEPDLSEASNINIQSPNENPIAKPTLKLVIKKQHGTLNSSFVDGSNVIRNDVLPGQKKKKKKKAKIFKIPKGLALKIRLEKLVDNEKSVKVITNNENKKLEDRRPDQRMADKILSKVDLSRKENKNKRPTLFDANIRIKQESLDDEKRESQIGSSGPTVENAKSLPIITRVCSGHLEANLAPSKDNSTENTSSLKAIQIKEEIVGLDDAIIESLPDSNRSAADDGLAKQTEREHLEANVTPTKANTIDNVSPLRVTQIKEEIIDLDDEIIEVFPESSKTSKQCDKAHLQTTVAPSKDQIENESPLKAIQIKEEIIDLDDEIIEVLPDSNKTAKQCDKEPLQAIVEPRKVHRIEKESPLKSIQIKEEIIDLDDEIVEVPADSNITTSIHGLATPFEREVENESLLIPLVPRNIQVKCEPIDVDEYGDSVSESHEIAMQEDVSTNEPARKEIVSKRNDNNRDNRESALLPVVAIKKERIDIDKPNMMVSDRHGKDSQDASIAPVQNPVISQVNTKVHKGKKVIRSTENITEFNHNIRIKEEKIDGVEVNVEKGNENFNETNRNIESNFLRAAGRSNIEVPTLDSRIRVKMEPPDNGYSSTVIPTTVSETIPIPPVGGNHPVQAASHGFTDTSTETVSCKVRVKLEAIDSDESPMCSNIDNVNVVTSGTDLHSSQSATKGPAVELQNSATCEVSHAENSVSQVDKHVASSEIQHYPQSMLRKPLFGAHVSVKTIEVETECENLEKIDDNTDGNERLSHVGLGPLKRPAKDTGKSKHRKRMHINPLNPANLSLLSIKVKRENLNDCNALSLFNPASKRLHEIRHDSDRDLAQTTNRFPSNTFIKQEPVDDEVRSNLISTPNCASGTEEPNLNQRIINDASSTTNTYDDISLQTSETTQRNEIQKTTPTLIIASVSSGGEILASTGNSSENISVEANTCDPNETSQPLLRIKSEFHSFNFSDDENSVAQEGDTETSEDSVSVSMANAVIKAEPGYESFIKSEPEYNTSSNSEHSDYSGVIKQELPLDGQDEMVEVTDRSMQDLDSLESHQNNALCGGNFIISRVESIRNKENMFEMNTNLEIVDNEMKGNSESVSLAEFHGDSVHKHSISELNVPENQVGDRSIGSEVVEGIISDNFTLEKVDDSDRNNSVAKEVVLSAEAILNTEVDNSREQNEIKVSESQEANLNALSDEMARLQNESELDIESNIVLPCTTVTHINYSSGVITETQTACSVDDGINLPSLSLELNSNVEPQNQGSNDNENNADVDVNEIVNPGDDSDKEMIQDNLSSLENIEDDKADITTEVDSSKPEVHNKGKDDSEKNCDGMNLETSKSQYNIDYEENSAASNELPSKDSHEQQSDGYEKQLDESETCANIENISDGNSLETQNHKQGTTQFECEAVANCGQKLKDLIKDNDNLLGFFDDCQQMVENLSKDQDETNFDTRKTSVCGFEIDKEDIQPSISATEECYSRNADVDTAGSNLTLVESVPVENEKLRSAIAERVSDDSVLPSFSKSDCLSSSNTIEHISSCVAESPASPPIIPSICALDSISTTDENPKIDPDESAAKTISLNPGSLPSQDDPSPGPIISTDTFSAIGSPRDLPPLDDPISNFNMLHMNEIAENINNANIERELQNDLESISSNSNFDFDDEAGTSGRET